MAQPPDPGADIAPVDAGRGQLLQVLVRHEVRFIVIGGAAIQSHGRRYVTEDIDLTPDTEADNMQRLADALSELDCRLVTDPADPASWVALPSDYFTPRSLRAASVWNLATRHGLLDLSFTPTGFPGGYANLVASATTMPAAGTSVSVLVASLEDVHSSERAAIDRRTGHTSRRSKGPERSPRSASGNRTVPVVRATLACSIMCRWPDAF